ncbi:hypothetical protein ACFQS4_01085 [Saliphagus sp. GCM10025317]
MYRLSDEYLAAYGSETALLSAIPVGIGQRGACDVCGRLLYPNAKVELLVLIDAGHVSVAATRCNLCSNGELEDGTERPCWLARGTLAPSVDPHGRLRLILSGAKVVDREA